MSNSVLVDIKTGTIKGTLPRRALGLVYDWLDLHLDDLMANWERFENGEELMTIEPLD